MPGLISRKRLYVKIPALAVFVAVLFAGLNWTITNATGVFSQTHIASATFFAIIGLAMLAAVRFRPGRETLENIPAVFLVLALVAFAGGYVDFLSLEQMVAPYQNAPLAQFSLLGALLTVTWGAASLMSYFGFGNVLGE